MTASYKTEIIISDQRQVSCDGSKQSDGHPRVYLQIGAENTVSCPYCSCKFQFNNDT